MAPCACWANAVAFYTLAMPLCIQILLAWADGHLHLAACPLSSLYFMLDLRTSSVSIRYHRGLICPHCQPVGLMGSLELEKQALTWAAMSHPCVRIILKPQYQRSLVTVSASMPNIGLRLSSTRCGEVDQNLTSVWQIPICF